MLNMFGQKVIGPCTINGINLGVGKKTGIACFNQTWCSKHWMAAPLAKSAFRHTKGMLFCCNPGTFYNSSRGRKFVGYSIADLPQEFICDSCPIGKFTNSVGIDNSCKSCPIGYHQNERGLQYCFKCPAGKYVNEQGSPECFQCSVNDFQNSPGKNFCKSCPAGYANIEMGSTSCNAVPPGSYYLHGKVYECDPGYFCSGLDAKQLECRPGTYAAVARSTSCTNCAPGKFSNNKSTVVCQDCNRNEYQPDPRDHTYCAKCPAGWLSDVGSTKCQSCEAGKYSSIIGQACKICSAGLYRSSGGDATKCFLCPAGFASAEGSVKCEICGAGQYSQIAGGDCKLCNVGQYRSSNMVDVTTCQSCEAGYYQSDVGQTSCLPCVQGEFLDIVGGNSCKLCSPSTYVSHKGRKIPCSNCPTGWSSAAGSAKCQACGAGTFGHGCQLCPLGYARNGTDHDATQCRLCKLGETTTLIGAASCERCDVGKFGSSKGFCTSCAAGTFQDTKGESACQKCPVDRFGREVGKSSLADCEKCATDRTTGLFVGRTSNVECMCKKKEYYTSDGGDCVACIEGANCSARDGLLISDLLPLPGYFLSSNNVSREFYFLNCASQEAYGEKVRAQEVCLGGSADPHFMCLEGYDGPLCMTCAVDYVRRSKECIKCVGGSSMVAAFAPIGIFSLIIFFFVFICMCRIKSDDDDDSDNDEKTNLTAVTPISVVAPELGFEDQQMAKTKMLRDWSLEKNQNIEKEEREKKEKMKEEKEKKKKNLKTKEQKQKDNVAAIKEKKGLHHHLSHRGISAARSLKNARRMKSMNNKQKAASNVMSRSKVIIGWMQIVGSMSATFESIPWPSNLLEFNMQLGVIINVDIGAFFSLSSCKMSIPYLESYVLRLSLLVCLCIAVLTCYAICWCMWGRKNPMKAFKQRTMTIKLLLATVLFLYPSICMKTFTSLRCKTLPFATASGSLRVLSQDWSIDCDSAEFLFFWKPLISSVIVLVVVGVPVLILTILIINRKHLHDVKSSQHHRVVMQFGSLFVPYDDEFWWFEVVVIIEKMILTGALAVVGDGTPVQTLLALLTAFVYMMVVLKTAPFKHDTDDLLSYVTSLQLCLTFLAALVLQMDVGSKNQFDSKIIGIVLIILNVVCLVLMVISLVFALAPLVKSLCCKKKNADTKDGKPDEEDDDEMEGGMEGF